MISGMNNIAERLIDLARGRSCRIVHASTSEVYGDPTVHPQPESYWGNVNPIGRRSCYDEGKLEQRDAELAQAERVGRGLYGLPGREVSAHGTLAEVARRIPKGIVCLLSALRFHGLTSQAPFEVWLAIENKAMSPKLDYPPLRIVRFSGLPAGAGLSLQVPSGALPGTRSE